MDGLGVMLEAHGMGFGDVVKSTTFYAGGNTAEDLHGNLAIRNRFYTEPGPASTGVPIARMADSGSKVRIEPVLRPVKGCAARNPCAAKKPGGRSAPWRILHPGGTFTMR